MLWLSAWRILRTATKPPARLQQRTCSGQPPRSSNDAQPIDYDKHPAYKKYSFIESAELMMQETDKPPTMVHRWDWHFWQFLISLVPAGMTYLGVLYIRRIMVEDARSQGLGVSTYAELQEKMPRQKSAKDKQPSWLKLKQVDELKAHVQALQEQVDVLHAQVAAQKASQTAAAAQTTDKSIDKSGPMPLSGDDRGPGWVSAAAGASWNAAAASWRWVYGRIARQRVVPGDKAGQQPRARENVDHVPSKSQ